MAEIILDHQDLVKRLEADRARGLRIAMTNGAFDLFHVGHLRSLVHAGSLADRLLVALNSDESVRRHKGPKRPINNESERAELIGALACVDYVTIFGASTVDSLLKLFRPELYCKGTDYTPETIPETPTVRAYGGELAIVGDPKDHSSTGLVERILDLHREP